MSETTNGKLLTEHAYKADGDGNTVDWQQIAANIPKITSLVNQISGGGSTSGSCVKPSAWASGAKWKAYNDCLQAQIPLKCWTPQEAPGFDALLNNSNPNGTDVYNALISLTGTESNGYKGLIAEMDREIGVHQSGGEDPNTSINIKCLNYEKGLYQGYAQRLLDKLNTIMPQACPVGQHWDATSHACVADGTNTNPAPNGGPAGPPPVVKPNWFTTPVGLGVTIGGTVLVIGGILWYGHSKLGWFSGK